MQLMLECKAYATRNLSSIKKKEFTFNNVGRAAFGFPGKFAVDLNVIFCNLGVCAGYIIFIASNLEVSEMNVCPSVCSPYPSSPIVVYNMFCSSRT